MTQVLPAASGPITFANAAVGGGTSTVAVQLQLNVAGTLTLGVPASSGGHVEYTVGTVSGCTVNGTTSNASGSVCSFNVTFAPYYTGQRQQPLMAKVNGQIYTFGLTGLGTGPQARVDYTNITTFSGSAGTTSSTAAPDGVSIASGILYEPEGLYADNSDNVYVADEGHYKIRILYQSANAQLACLIQLENPTTFGVTGNNCSTATSQPVVGDLYTLAGTGANNPTIDNALATAGGVNPAGVEVDPFGNVFIGDNGNSRIRVIYQGGASIACLIQIENPTTFGVTGGNCSTATSQPTVGYIYTIAGTGVAGYSVAYGTLATSTALTNPNDVAVDAAGDVFTMNFTASATPTSTQGGRILVIYNGGALAAQLITLENPTVTTPVVGNIYLIAGGSTATEGGNGVLATSSGVGALTIYGLRIDAYDNVYFSDKTYGSGSATTSPTTNTALVRVVYNGTSTASNPLATLIGLENSGTTAKPGYIYTVGGEAGTASISAATVDGVLATAQQFSGVYGIALDPAGDIIVADRLNFTVRRISAATGLINTIAGTPNTTNAIANGNAQLNQGRFWGSWGITIDSAGGFFTDDYLANRVRLITSAPSATYPLIVPGTNVGTQSGIQGYWITNVGTPGSTLTLTADNLPDTQASPFGFLSPAGIAGITECAATSTTALQTSTITTAVNLGAGSSCSLGVAALPLNGGYTNGTATTTDNSLNTAGTVQSQNVAILAVGVKTTLTYSPTPAIQGQPETLTATLITATNASPASAPVTAGTVYFYITSTTSPPGTLLGSATLDPVLGTASITTSALVSPSTSITTVYNGDTAVNAAFTPSTSVTVIPVALTLVTLQSSNLTPNLGQSVTYTATVSSPVQGGPFSGTMTIEDTSVNNFVMCTGAVNPTTGVYTCSFSSLSAGTHLIKACYSNDPNYVSACSSTVTEVVTAPGWTPSVTSAAGIAIIDGQSALVNLQVASVGGYTGTVTVSCGTAPLPTGMSCLFSPSTFPFTGLNNTELGTVTITTSYNPIGMLRPSPDKRGAVYAGFLVPGAGIAALFGLLALRRRRSLSVLRACAVFLIGGALLLGISGCSPNNVILTPKGTYNIPLVFTDGTITTTINETVSVIGISDTN